MDSKYVTYQKAAELLGVKKTWLADYVKRNNRKHPPKHDQHILVFQEENTVRGRVLLNWETLISHFEKNSV